MNADDLRHGTESGFEQHGRDGENPCDACYQADILASRRRGKRRAMGHQFTKLVGENLHNRIVDLRTRGARLEDIAEWAGITDSQVHRIIQGGPDQRIYARTWLALTNMKPTPLITPVGVQRRLRALAWLGWAPSTIAAHCGLHQDTISDIRDRGIQSTAKTRAIIAEAYEELSMRRPPSDTAVQRRAVGLVRSFARRKGFAPPLAWDGDTIDDPEARPQGASKGSRPLKTHIDPVVVQRVLAGDRMPTTQAEKVAITAQWEASGRSLNDLERLTGWRSDRYTVREAS